MQKLDSLIKEHDLEEYKEKIYKSLKPTIYLNFIKKDDYKEVGGSRLGGSPDIPKDFIWPKTNDNKFMTFIAQLNLEKISLNDEKKLLPKTGMLYFFMGMIEGASDIEHKVIYSKEKVDFKLLKIEEQTILEEAFDFSFIPHIIESKSCNELPNYAYADSCVPLEIESFESLEEEYSWENQNDNHIGKIYGYPNAQHSDLELQAALKIIANHKYNYDEDEVDILIKTLNNDKQKAKDEIENIIMLLELDSDDDLGFEWSDSGVIHFFIRKEDLENLNFDNTYLSLYSS